MTSPLAPAAPAPTPTAAGPAATDAPGGGERFASALDDAVAGGRGGPRGQEPAAEGEGTPAEPTAEVPAGEQPVTGPGVSPAGMPPALWALLTGIGPGAAAPVALDGAAPVAPDATPPVAPAGDAAPPVGPAGDAAPAAGAVPTLPTVTGSVAGVLPTVAGTAAPVAAPPVDGLPSSAVPGAATTTVPVPAPVDAASPAAAPTVPLAPAADPLPGFTVVVAAPGTPVPAVAPAADEVPATVAPADLPAVAAAAPGEGAAPDTGSAPDQDTPPPAPAAAAPATAAAAGPAVPAVAPVAVAEPAAPAAPAPPVSGQVAQQVAVLRTAPDGTHTMTVVLTPETLGPVEVQVTLTQGSVELTLKSATEAGRSALLEALPDLRRDLAGAGLTCTNASVDRDPGGSWASAQQHATGDRAGQHGQPDGRGRPWLRGTDVDAGRSAPVPSTAVPSSGLDVRV